MDNSGSTNQYASSLKLEKIRSRYILKLIFNILNNTKSLKIIKYNKKIKKRLDIDIDNYKKSSIIEIDIIPNENPHGKFINILNEKEKDFYHIYFNSNYKREIKKYFLGKYEKVDKISIKINYQIKTFFRLFEDCECIKSIYFKTFYRDDIFNMSYMFAGCTFLKEIKFSNFITKNVSDLSLMFFGCSSLKELNLSNFNTNNVTNMCSMFYECSLLKKLNVSNFITNNVTNMSDMFFCCSSLIELNISNFNTTNVTNMSWMFDRCPSLKELNLSNFNTVNVTDMSYMFTERSSLKKLNLSRFDTHNVTNMK